MWVDQLIRNKWLVWLSIPGLTEGMRRGWRCCHSSSTRSGCQDFFDYYILFSKIDFVTGSTGLWSFWLAKKNRAPLCQFVLGVWCPQGALDRRWWSVLKPFLSVGTSPSVKLGFTMTSPQTLLTIRDLECLPSLHGACGLHMNLTLLTVSTSDLCLFVPPVLWVLATWDNSDCSKCIL